MSEAGEGDFPLTRHSPLTRLALRAIHPLPQGERGSAIAARSRPAPIQFSNSHADALIRCRARKPRRALPFPPRKLRGGGAPKGATTGPRLRPCGLRQARAVRKRASPLGAPPVAFLSPGPCFRAPTGGLVPTPIRAAFAALRPRRVQPLKAAGLRAGGR